MSDNVSLEYLTRRVTELTAEKDAVHGPSAAEGLKTGNSNGTSGGMDLTTYRLDQYEKRADAADARMGRVEDKLNAIQLTLAGLATKDSIRNWGIAVIAIVIATGLGVGGLLLQSSGNQLSAFQSGLSAIQTVVAAHDVGAPPAQSPPQQAPTPPALGKP